MDNFDLKKFVSEKTLLNENAPGFDTRKTGEPLPTLESVQAAYEAKNAEDKVESSSASSVLAPGPDTNTLNLNHAFALPEFVSVKFTLISSPGTSSISRF